jgi:hypothetical protein
MKCTLHKLLEELDKGNNHGDACVVVSGPSPDVLLGHIAKVGSKAIAFWMGEFDSIARLKFIPELVQLPFPICWFETEVIQPDPSRCFNVGIFCTERSGGFDALLFLRRRGHDVWFLCGSAQCSNSEVGSLETHSKIFRRSQDHDLAQFFMDALFSFLSALNCQNVSMVKTEIDPRLQKSRAKKGRRPIFDYWTLAIHLDRYSPERREASGAHAAPRVHLRRGHFRELASGLYCWVRACVVGDKTIGMIHKEYAAA